LNRHDAATLVLIQFRLVQKIAAVPDWVLALFQTMNVRVSESPAKFVWPWAFVAGT
jgi:hypothetical protein